MRSYKTANLPRLIFWGLFPGTCMHFEPMAPSVILPEYKGSEESETI
jgi:hypothetical protein